MPHSQGLSNNPYSELDEPTFSYRYFFKDISNIVFPSTPRPIGLPAKGLKALLPSSNLGT